MSTSAATPASPCDIPCTQALDALDLLSQGLEQTRALADECRRFARHVGADHDMRPVAEALCSAIHRMAALEEALFCPAAREALAGSSAIAMAELEHATARQIIRQMQMTDPREARYEALVIALTDCVERHATHERRELFPRLREAHLDLEAIGERISERRQAFEATH